MTTKQTAMQQSTVLLCCNSVEHDKVSQMILLKCIFITFFQHDERFIVFFFLSSLHFKEWTDIMVSWHHKKVSGND